MSVEVLEGFPKKGFLNFLLINGIGSLIVFLGIVITRALLREKIFSFWGGLFYISILIICTVIIAVICGEKAWMIYYGHYKRSQIMLIYFLIMFVSGIVVGLFALQFCGSLVSFEEREYKRVFQLNNLMCLCPMFVIFVTSCVSYFDVKKDSCSQCKILHTVVEENKEVVLKYQKRHTHKEKGHYETDTTEIIDPYSGVFGTTEYVAKTKRWVEGEVVDDGLFEHSTTEHHMVCINCGNRFVTVSKDEKKIGD